MLPILSHQPRQRERLRLPDFLRRAVAGKIRQFKKQKKAQIKQNLRPVTTAAGQFIKRKKSPKSNPVGTVGERGGDESVK